MSSTLREPALERLVAAARSRYRTAEELVTAVVRDAIVAGLFRPGERLTQDRLAGLLEVSRMPIRAALRQLDSEGLLVLHAHRGASVRALTREEISDLYEIRIQVETFALRKSVTAAGRDDVADLVRMADAVDRGSESERIGAAAAFYEALYSVGNTPRVVSLVMQIRAELNRYRAGLRSGRTEAHRKLAELVGSGDPTEAAAWLERHLRDVAAALQAQLGKVEATARV